MPSQSTLRMQALIERWLPDDPFEQMVQMLTDRTAFSFSRFGDGEFNAIFGVDGTNCDGHPYYSDLGLRLRQIVTSKPSYLMGLQPLAVAVHGARHILRLSGGLPTAGGMRWVLGDSLHNASLDGRLGIFVDALKARRVLLVGPDRLRVFATSRGWDHYGILAHDCWKGYPEAVAWLMDNVSESGDVVFFCASMMSNVLIDDLFRFAPENTYIDAGSVFDPYAGVISRVYHETLDSDVLDRLRVGP